MIGILETSKYQSLTDKQMQPAISNRKKSVDKEECKLGRNLLIRKNVLLSRYYLLIILNTEKVKIISFIVKAYAAWYVDRPSKNVQDCEFISRSYQWASPKRTVVTWRTKVEIL